MGKMKIGNDIVKTRVNAAGIDVPICYRQGDVYIFALDDEQDLGTTVEKADITLALGEVTGHHHTINRDGQATLERKHVGRVSVSEALLKEHGDNPRIETIGEGTITYFELDVATNLAHDEHDKIELPAGKYKSTIQVEYSPEEIQAVRD